MGKNIAKHGFKSGVLPTTRRILKKPTTKQYDLVEKAKQPAPKGFNGTGYAKGIVAPKGVRREQPKMEFINVDKLIAKTVPAPNKPKTIKSEKQAQRAAMAELRRTYLSEALRKEEEKLLYKSKLLKEREESVQKQQVEERKRHNQAKASDLTVPTLENILKEPLMRDRTPEEKELLDMKRKYNRELLEFQTKERKLEKLIELYHVSDQFIVTEEQLLQKVEEVFEENRLRESSILSEMNTSKEASRIETVLADNLFGTVGGGKYVGLPIIKRTIQDSVAEDTLEK